MKGIISGLLSEASRRFFEKKVVIKELPDVKPGYLLTMQITTEPLPEADRVIPRSNVDAVHQKNASLWHDVFASLGRRASCGRNVARPDQPKQTRSEVKSDTAYLDRLGELVKADPENAGDVLMRAVPASAVCAEWNDLMSLEQAREFWETYAGDTRYFSYSKCAPRAARFVSHSWRAPSNWSQLMGQNTSYAEAKGH